MNPNKTTLAPEALAALLDKPDALTSLVNTMPAGMLVYDHQKKLVLCNDAAQQITGFTPEQLGNLQYLSKELRFFDENRNSISWENLPCVQSFLHSSTAHDCIIGLAPAHRSTVWVKGYAYPVMQEDKKHIRFLVLTFISITEQHIAEEKLIQFSRDWHSVLNNSRSAVFLLNTSFHIKMANSSARQLLREYGKEDAINEHVSFLDVILPERKSFVKANLEKVLSGEPVEYESFFKNEQGEDMWLYTNYMPVTGEKNELKEICITINNITHIHKEKEKALAENNRWKLALEGGKDGVWEYNFETQEAYYSPLYKEMLGFTDEEFENSFQEWAGRLHPDDKTTIEQLDQRYLNQETDHHAIEYRIKNKSGEYIWVLDRGMVAERDADGKPKRLVGTHKNITARKEAEEALRLSEQRFSSFMRNTPTMNWIIDEQAVFRYLNKQYMESFALTSEAIGKSIYELFPAATCDAFIENNKKVWESGTVLDTTEEGVLPDGSPQWYHVVKFPLPPENGIRLLGGVALDITRKVTMEKQLAADEARSRREMVQAIMDAQENERKELSDELHDNVNQILSSAKLMLESASSRQQGENHFIEKGLFFLNHAIQEIRKLSHNLTPGLLHDIGLDAAINELVRNINSTGKLSIDFIKTGDISPDDVKPDIQLAVLRITQEQLNNIIRHAHASMTTIELIITEASILLIISDNGRGFDPKTTRRGIGLKNIFNRAEYFGGQAAIESREGSGCRLQVSIPLLRK